MVLDDTFKAACMAATLATAWSATLATAWSATPASATAGEPTTDIQFSADANVSMGLRHLTILNGLSQLTSVGSFDFAAGGGVHWAGTLLLQSPSSALTRPWGLLAIGTDNSGTEHLVMSFADPSSAIGHEWPFASSFSEQQIIASLRAGTELPSDFSTAYYAMSGVGQTPNSAARVVAFSTGQDIGTFTLNVEAVPTPGALSISAIGLAMAARRRRR